MQRAVLDRPCRWYYVLLNIYSRFRYHTYTHIIYLMAQDFFFAFALSFGWITFYGLDPSLSDCGWQMGWEFNLKKKTFTATTGFAYYALAARRILNVRSCVVSYYIYRKLLYIYIYINRKRYTVNLLAFWSLYEHSYITYTYIYIKQLLNVAKYSLF